MTSKTVYVCDLCGEQTTRPVEDGWLFVGPHGVRTDEIWGKRDFCRYMCAIEFLENQIDLRNKSKQLSENKRIENGK